MLRDERLSGILEVVWQGRLSIVNRLDHPGIGCRPSYPTQTSRIYIKIFRVQSLSPHFLNYYIVRKVTAKKPHGHIIADSVHIFFFIRKSFDVQPRNRRRYLLAVVSYLYGA